MDPGRASPPKKRSEGDIGSADDGEVHETKKKCEAVGVTVDVTGLREVIVISPTLPTGVLEAVDGGSTKREPRRGLIACIFGGPDARLSIARMTGEMPRARAPEALQMDRDCVEEMTVDGPQEYMAPERLAALQRPSQFDNAFPRMWV
ncbi:hypothetical protein Efla_007396 [Eimeria flavescens]